MAPKAIVLYPDEILTTPSAEVSKIDEEIRLLVDDMIETMYAANGIGLAAPQVGVLKRVIVFDTSEDRTGAGHLINPVIIEHEGEVISEEGCLSIPDYRDTITRHEIVKVAGLNLNGEKIEISAGDLLSRCLQHEIDHIEGVLFIDRLSKIKRDMFNKWFKKHRSERF